MMARRQNAAYLSILIFLSVLLWLPRLQGPLDLRYDAGVYYILGTSLAEGKGYRLLNEPGEILAIQYPPLLPLFAAAHQVIAGTSDPAIVGHWLRWSFFVVFIALVVATFVLCRRFLSPGFSFLATLMLLLHLNTIWFSELFFAELPFALTSLLFLLVTSQRNGPSQEWLAWLLGVGAFLLRSSGVALLAAWVGESLLRRRFKEMAVRTVLALIPFLAWQGYIAQVKTSAEYSQPAYEYQRAGYQNYNVGYLENLLYVDPYIPEQGIVSFEGLVKRLGLNLMNMPGGWGEAVSSRSDWVRLQLERINQEFSPIPAPLWFVDVAMALVGVLIFAGLVQLVRRGERLIPLYVAGTVMLICLTPWPGQFGRYLAPLTPLFVLALFVAMSWMRDGLSMVSNRQWRMVGGILMIMVAIGIFGPEGFALWKVYTKQDQKGLTFLKDYQGKRHDYRLFFYTDAWRLHDEAIEWLKEVAKPNEIIATSTPQWLYLKTGLRAVMPPFEPDVREAQRLIDSVPVSYLIIDELQFLDITRRYAKPVVEAFLERWELVYSTGDSGSQIYRRMNSGGLAGPHSSGQLSSRPEFTSKRRG